MLLMGESINGTRKQVAEAIQARDAEFIKTLAKDQIDAGAGLLDVNGGVAGGDEVADLLWLIEIVMGVTDMQLMVDSANPKALDAGVQAIIDKGGKVPFINSISGEQPRIDAVMPLVEKHKCPVVGLCLSDEGIPPTAEDRFAVAKQIFDLCTGAGLPAEDLWIDPLVMAVSADPCAPGVTMETLKLVKDRLPSRTTGGLSNVSFGLPNRAPAQPHLRGHVRRPRPRRPDRRRAQQADDGHHQVHRGAARRGQLLRLVPQGAPRRHPGVAAGRDRAGRCRLRDLGVAVGRLPAGPLNAITDVPGVRVGHCTVSWGGPELPHGSGPARTGVTAIFPHGGDLWHERVVAGALAANGVGEIIGISAVREWGLIETPILLTNSQSAGAVYDATVRWIMEREPLAGVEDAVMPVVGECDDGFLNDLRGMHVREEHVRAALDGAAAGPVAEGCVGAGTGMSCYDFKAGIGTSSRLVTAHGRPWTVGVLALTNFGVRHRLSVDGVPVGREITDLMPLENREGSCIVVLATDAPLSARQCERLAKRCALGLAATGSYASDGSGEIMLAFTTAHRVPRVVRRAAGAHHASPTTRCTELFEAAVDATAESVCNALTAATTTVGRDGNTAYALPLDRLVGVLRRAGREARLPGA